MSTTKDLQADAAHIAQCTVHIHQARGKPTCSAVKRNGMPCGNKASLFPPNFLPICKVHQSHLKPAAACQAIATCGKLCGRPCHFVAHQVVLCLEHKYDIKTCYLLKIPTELRMLIFQYVFPARIPPYHNRDWINDRCGSILKVNRQTNKEATAVLYEQIPFGTSISQCGIWMCDNDLSEIDGLPGYIRRIRRIHVDVDFETDLSSSSDSILYGFRHSIRKFVNSIGPDKPDPCQRTPFLKELSITLGSVWHSRPDFDDLFFVITFLLAPFQDLRHIARPTLELSSLTSLCDTNPSQKEVFLEFERQFEANLSREPIQISDPAIISRCEALGRMSKRLTTLEKFGTLLEEPVIDERTFSNAVRWIYIPAWHETVFSEFAHILSYVRFLRENEEIDGFDAIHKAIQQQWETYHAYQHQYTKKITKGIAALGDGDDSGGETETGKEIPDSGQDQGVAVGEFTDRGPWAGLDLDYSLPFANEDQELVEQRDDIDRVYFSFNGQTKFRLKTPDLLQKLREN